MQDATEFGKILKIQMAKNNFNQEKLAKELGISTASMSNYITGKSIPEMDILSKFIKKFGLEKKEILELFYFSFFYSATMNQKITVKTKHIVSNRIKGLAKVMTIFLLYDKIPNDYRDKDILKELMEKIDMVYKNVISEANLLALE